MGNWWVWEKFLAPTLVTLGQGHQATEAGQNLTFSHNKVRTAHPIPKKQTCPPCHAFDLNKWRRNSVRNFYFKEFLHKISIHFSSIEHYICHILGMVDPIDVKQKGNESTECYAD